MGNKPIEFEGFAQTASSDCKMKVMACGDGIDIHWNDFFVSVYRDPAKLDALADAIKRAADALRASQALTFADLKPGEWFRWAQHRDDASWAARKVDACTIVNPENWQPAYGAADPVVAITFGGLPVIRVTATFTPADAVSK